MTKRNMLKYVGGGGIGGGIYENCNISLGSLWDRALKNIQRIFLHIFATVMPHFVVEYIHDEKYVKL